MEVCEEHDLSRSPVSEHYNTTEHHYKFRIMQVKSNHSGSQTHTEGDGWLMVCISITKQPLFSLSFALSLTSTLLSKTVPYFPLREEIGLCSTRLGDERPWDHWGERMPGDCWINWALWTSEHRGKWSRKPTERSINLQEITLRSKLG